MALVAQGVDLRHIQQPGILRTVRRMAAHASFCLDCRMLVHEGAARLRMALGADQVLIGRGLQVAVPECAVNVMTVTAFDQAFVHPVVKRHIECRLHVGVALKAEHGLRGQQQFFLVLAPMYAVAACAANVGFGMGRTFEVGMRSGMAAQARFVHFRRRGLGGIEDLGNVTGAFDVRLTRAVTSLAGGSGLAMLEGQLAVRIGIECLRLRIVACGANFGADIIRRIRVLDLRRDRLR